MRALAAALVLALPAAAAAHAPAAGGPGRELVPPPGFMRPAQHGGGGRAAECPGPPRPFTGALEFPSKYEGSGKARDRLNPRAEAKYRKATAPITELEKGVSRMTAQYLRTGSADALGCALGWMEAWARADALRDDTDDHTGKSMRKWALASLAAAYARLKFSASDPLRGRGEQARRIEAWLEDLGEQVVGDWSGQPLPRINNHEYWAAWAVMATAVVLDRRDFFDWAVALYRTAAKQVDGQGYLPNELQRETRALNYHNYALGPLAMIAAFAKANGLDLAHENNGALRRLATRVLMGLDDPSAFEQRTGARQTADESADPRSRLAWLEAYCWATNACIGPLRERVASLRPLTSTRLGGNLTEIFAAAASETAWLGAPEPLECEAGPREKIAAAVQAPSSPPAAAGAPVSWKPPRRRH